MTEPAESSTTTAGGTPFDWRGLLTNQTTVLLLVWFAMIALFTIIKPLFFSVDVAGNILLDWAPVALIAVGELFVIISGGIDLSVGATVGLSGVLGALVMKSLTASGTGSMTTILIGLLVCIATGVTVGLINAWLINVINIVPFIATLVTLGAGSGLALVLTGGAPIGQGPSGAIELSIPWLGPLSTPELIVIVILAICGAFLARARFGRYTYAIGSNDFAAKAVGINVRRHLVKIYVLSGFLSGLAGMFFYLRLGSGAPTSGQGAELDAIAAVVIGGAALTGGVGKMGGTILGAFILTTVTSGLIIIGVEPNWKQVVVAILIAVAVGVRSFRPTRGRAS